MTDREKMYRRQLGGAEAALRRERQRVKALEELAVDLWLNMEKGCAHYGDKWHLDPTSQRFADRFKELGIEVEE